MRRIACLALWVALVAVHPGIAGAEQGAKLEVVYTKWFPYTYTDNGTAAGFEVDILRRVLHDMGREASFTELPWKRCLASLAQGRADLLVSLLRTPERERFAAFPDEHISVSRTVLFTATDNELRYDGGLKSLAGRKIGVIMGFSYGEAFDRADFLDKDPAVDADTLIRRVLHGHNALAAENEYVAKALATRLGVRDRLRFLEPPIHEQKLYVGFSRAAGRQALAEEFSRALAAFKGTPAYGEILQRYGVAD